MIHHLRIYDDRPMIFYTSDLVSHLSKQSALSEEQATEVIQLILDWIMTSLKGGGEVRLADFGHFWIQELPKNEGFNPKTGRQMVFPPTNRPMFKGSKEFRKMMNAEKPIKPPANDVDLPGE